LRITLELVAVTGRKEPSPTTIDEGLGYRGKEMCDREED
jgi:hypothetical protein